MFAGIQCAIDLIISPVLPVLRTRFSTGAAKIIAGIRIKLGLMLLYYHNLIVRKIRQTIDQAKND